MVCPFVFSEQTINHDGPVLARGDYV